MRVSHWLLVAGQLLVGVDQSQADFCDAATLAHGTWGNCDAGGLRSRIDTEWTCLPGTFVPVRLNSNGDVECMSANNHDCMWKNSQAECEALLPKPVLPVDCTQANLNDPTHWCAKTRATLKTLASYPAQASDTSGWTCIDGVNTPVRMDSDGDVQCMSTNYKDCFWRTSKAACQDVLDLHFNLKPLACGAMCQKEWGFTGYDKPGHWCATSEAALTKLTPQQCSCGCDASLLSKGLWSSCDANGVRGRLDGVGEWKCYPGINVPVRMNPGGNVECMSTNHHDCLWSNSCDNVLKNHPATLDPLICGDMHLGGWAITGYDTPGHWCAVGKDLMSKLPQGQKCACICDDAMLSKGIWSTCDASGMRTRTEAYQWKCYTGINVPIRLNKNNDVECMSGNHHDCMWRNSQADCQAVLASHPAVDPLVCGAMHLAGWGGPGYDIPTHWCAVGKTILTKLPAVEKCMCPQFAVPRVPAAYNWGCYPGINVPVRLNQNGDVECMSANHHDCLWSPNCNDVLNNHPTLDPLACGAMCQKEWGFTGYDKPGHWCAVSQDILSKLT